LVDKSINPTTKTPKTVDLLIDWLTSRPIQPTTRAGRDKDAIQLHHMTLEMAPETRDAKIRVAKRPDEYPDIPKYFDLVPNTAYFVHTTKYLKSYLVRQESSVFTGIF
jgi:hypothetical protein